MFSAIPHSSPSSVLIALLFIFALFLLHVKFPHLPRSSPSSRHPLRHTSPAGNNKLKAQTTQNLSALSKLPPPSVSVSYIPSHAEHSLCWIFTCTDRQLAYTQAFRSPFFRHLRLPMPPGLGVTASTHPVWCRAYYLRLLRGTGQRCVVYADDDIYLDLDALRQEVLVHEDGEVLVTAGPRHRMRMHINAGFVVFTNLQSKVGKYLAETWWAMRWQPGDFPFHYLRDQMALNRLVRCEFEGVVCYYNAPDRRDGRRLGLVGHCFSIMEKKRKGAKEQCMKRLKTKVRQWDTEVEKDLERSTTEDEDEEGV